jgi:hypothetical protein
LRFLNFSTAEFEKNFLTGIFGIKNGIGIPLPMGVPEIGTKNWNSQPRLGLTAVSRKVSPIEPLPHDNMDARAKLKAETGLIKIKVILGWLFNFRTMTIALPKNKFNVYSKAILDMLD